MKEKFLMDLIGCYREYFPENIPVECRKTAALIVFRFAIPDEELDHICKLLIETELGELESAVYQAYRFYISETVLSGTCIYFTAPGSSTVRGQIWIN